MHCCDAIQMSANTKLVNPTFLNCPDTLPCFVLCNALISRLTFYDKD